MKSAIWTNGRLSRTICASEKSARRDRAGERENYDCYAAAGGAGELPAHPGPGKIRYCGAAEAEGGAGDSEGRPRLARREGGHAHHGRHHVHHRFRRGGLPHGLGGDAAGGVCPPVRVPLCPDIRPYRLCGRLPQGPPAPERGPDGQAEVYPPAGGGGAVSQPDAL